MKLINNIKSKMRKTILIETTKLFTAEEAKNNLNELINEYKKDIDFDNNTGTITIIDNKNN